MAEKKDRYIEAVGRRKTAIARVRITPGGKTQYAINGKALESYFPTIEWQRNVMQPISKTTEGFKVEAKVSGGGISAQSDAVRLGIARALVSHTPEMRKELKQAGFLKRDPRIVERKKFGLRKARKSPKWSKR